MSQTTGSSVKYRPTKGKSVLSASQALRGSPRSQSALSLAMPPKNMGIAIWNRISQTDQAGTTLDLRDGLRSASREKCRWAGTKIIRKEMRQIR